VPARFTELVDSTPIQPQKCQRLGRFSGKRCPAFPKIGRVLTGKLIKREEMKTWAVICLSVATIVAGFFLVACFRTEGATITWTNLAGGGWNAAANWDPNSVPGAGDTALITVAANYSVSLDVSPTVAGLVLGASSGSTTQSFFTAGQTLTVNGPIEVNSQGQFNLDGGAVAGSNTLTGTLNWSGGYMSGNMTAGSNSILNIVSGGGMVQFYGFVLTNYGTVNWTNTTLHGINGNNAEIYNYGLWNAQSDDTFAGAFNAGTPTLFDNFGMFVKSGNTGVTTLDAGVLFNNAGMVNVEGGTLDINGGTNSDGEFATVSGGTINFSGCLFTNSTSFTGTGSFVAGDATFGGTIAGTLNWEGGHLTGTATLASNSVLNIVFGGGTAMFRGLVLTNYGTVNWTNTTLHGVDGYNEQIYNYGLWNAQSDDTFAGAFNGGAALFDNFGTFLKSGNTGVTTLEVGAFNNSGLVDVQNGTLDIAGGTSSDGEFTTAGGGTVSFSGYLFTNNTTFTGMGSFVAGDTTFGGTIAGTLNWSGGVISGSMTVATNSMLNIVFGGGNVAEFNGLALTNYGTVNWTNTTLHGVNFNNEQIYNYGLWNAQGDDTFAGAYNGGPALFANFGKFLKSGNTGVTTLEDGIFNNSGMVNVAKGTLDIYGGTSSDGEFTTAGGGTVNFSGCIFTNSTTFTGLGSFVAGDTTFGGTIVGTLNWSGGVISGSMTVASNSMLNIVFGGGNAAEFNGLVLTNYGTVNWTNTTLHGVNGNNEQIYNYGLWNAQSDDTFAGAFNGGTTLFDNFGTFLKSGNTGVTTLDAGVVFNNTGRVDSQIGNISLQGPCTLADGTRMSFGLGGAAGNGSISLSGAASFAGSLTVNLKGLFWPAAGSSFNLLNYASESGLLFTNMALPEPGDISWQTNYTATAFALSVTAHTGTNTTPTNLNISAHNGTNLILQWPSDHTGWRLEAQTNPVTVGITTNWATLEGSSLTNQIIMPIDLTNGSVFFRMIYP
jgi:hypothetical protein